jgi:hypothetical protein
MQNESDIRPLAPMGDTAHTHVSLSACPIETLGRGSPAGRNIDTVSVKNGAWANVVDHAQQALKILLSNEQVPQS